MGAVLSYFQLSLMRNGPVNRYELLQGEFVWKYSLYKCQRTGGSSSGPGRDEGDPRPPVGRGGVDGRAGRPSSEYPS